jgi:protein O-mannosyl-transferase
MSSSSSTTRVSARPAPSRGVRIITSGLVIVWAGLMSFAVLALVSPGSMQVLAGSGRAVEARDYQDYGDALLRAGKLDLAISQYHRALQIKPDFVAAQVNLAVASAKRGDIAAAEEMLRRALAQPTGQKGVIYFQLAELSMQQKRPAEAERYYTLALEANAPAALVNRRLGSIHFAAGDLARARDEFEMALTHQTDLTASYREMLYSSLAAWQDDSVHHPSLEALAARSANTVELAAFDTTVIRWSQSFDPDISRAHCDLGTVYAQQGNRELAARHFHKALEIWPGNTTAQGNLSLLQRAPATQLASSARK